jgi:hypothetical protein
MDFGANSMAGRNKAARPGPAVASDEQVRALLDRYQCPVAFHEVRTRFLGNIATPSMTASPIKMIQDLWGGELPAFDSIDAANELIGALIMGLWNRLTRHQNRNSPFRLNRIETAPTREGLADLSRMRVQEIDGFVDGLFGREDRIDLPERAHRALDDLAKMRALFGAVQNVATDETNAPKLGDVQTTLRHLREMTKHAEHAMHTVVLSCTRARKQTLSASSLLGKAGLH